MDKRPWTICMWSALVGFSLVSGSGIGNPTRPPNHDQDQVEVHFLGPKRVGLFNIENLQSSERVIRGLRSKRVLPRYKRAYENEFHDWNRFRNNLAHGGSEAINYGIGCANAQTKVDAKKAKRRKKRQTGEFFEAVNHPRGFPHELASSLRLKHPSIPREHLQLMTGGANAANLGIGWANSANRVTGSQGRNLNRANLGHGQANAYNFGIGCANANTEVNAGQNGGGGEIGQNLGSGGSHAINFGIGCANAGTQVGATQGGSRGFDPYLSRNPFNDKDNFFKHPKSKSNRLEYLRSNRARLFDLARRYGYDGSNIGNPDDGAQYRNTFNRYGFRYGPIPSSRYVDNPYNNFPEDYRDGSLNSEDIGEPEALRATRYLPSTLYRTGPTSSSNFAPRPSVDGSRNFTPDNYFPLINSNYAQGLTRAENFGIGDVNAVNNGVYIENQGFNQFPGVNTAMGTTYSSSDGIGNTNAVTNSVIVQNHLRSSPQTTVFRNSPGLTNIDKTSMELDYPSEPTSYFPPEVRYGQEEVLNSNRYWLNDQPSEDEYDTATNDHFNDVTIVPVPFYDTEPRGSFRRVYHYEPENRSPIDNRMMLIPLEGEEGLGENYNNGGNRNKPQWGVAMKGDQVFPPNRNLEDPIEVDHGNEVPLYSEDQLRASNRGLIGGGLLAAGLIGGGILGGIGGLLLGKAKAKHHQPAPPPPLPPPPTSTTQRTTTVDKLIATLPTPTPTMTLPFVKEKIVWLNGRKYIKVNGQLKPYHLFKSRLFQTWGPSCAKAARDPSPMPICKKYFGFRWRQLVLRWLLRKQKIERENLRRRELTIKKRAKARQIRKKHNEIVNQKRRHQIYQNNPAVIEYEVGSDFEENNDEYDAYEQFSNELETRTERDQEGFGLDVVAGKRGIHGYGGISSEGNFGSTGIAKGQGIGANGQKASGAPVGIRNPRFGSKVNGLTFEGNGRNNFNPGNLGGNSASWITYRNMLPQTPEFNEDQLPQAGADGDDDNQANDYQVNEEVQITPAYEDGTLPEQVSEESVQEVTNTNPNKVTQQVTKGVKVTVEERPSDELDSETKDTNANQNNKVEAERVTMERIANIEKRMEKMLEQQRERNKK